jgi:hypothetical protein
MLRRPIRPSKVRTSILVLSAILFIGMVVMAYGFFHNDSHIIYLGLFITGATSFTILVQSRISQNSARRAWRIPLSEPRENG